MTRETPSSSTICRARCASDVRGVEHDLAKRWKDPAFPSSFPHFNTEEYWNRETRDLEEQLARCEEIALRGY